MRVYILAKQILQTEQLLDYTRDNVDYNRGLRMCRRVIKRLGGKSPRFRANESVLARPGSGTREEELNGTGIIGTIQVGRRAADQELQFIRNRFPSPR